MAKPRASGTSPSAVILLVLANILIPVAILTFGKGFFPYKPLLPGLAQYEDLGYGPPAPAPFDRVIFMVVDALRSDFVYVANSGFQFTQSLIRNGAAVPFTAHATSPTVTMPRIKAITTGSIPSFLDVVLNVDEGDKSSSLAHQDTWLAQMKAKASGRLVLYGDDTWLKLFPETFDRADGTSSFFVSDFTEVDNNVTRHVPAQLAAADWSVTVLHYLGLDHIGHKGGPRSPNMRPKQAEMDGIVQQIYEALASKSHLRNTLLVLAGDHGMNDAGNHGASSAGETSPALVFIAPGLQPLSSASRPASPLPESPDFQYYRTVEQSDLAPTLAALLGFPVPKNNLGAFIPDFLPLWPKHQDRVQILMHNAHQILNILTAAFGTGPFAAPSASVCAHPQSDVEELGCEWHALVHTPSAQQDDQWVERTVKTMSGMASNYNLPLLGFGLTAATMALIFAMVASCSILASPASGPASAQSLAAFALINIVYGVMMFASSYVEEEQHFWYWGATAWLAVLTVRRLGPSTPSPSSFSRSWASLAAYAFSTVATFVAVRLVRGWNQTGQKFAGEPDLVKTFLQPNPALLWVLVLGTYLYAAIQLARDFLGFLPAAVSLPGVASLLVSAFAFKLMFTYEDSPELVRGSGLAHMLVDVFGVDGGRGPSLVTRARVVFVGVGLAAAAAAYGVRQRYARPRLLLAVYMVLGMTQSRTTNIPLFLLFGVVFRFLERQVEQSEQVERSEDTIEGTAKSETNLGPVEITTATLLLQFAAFFAFGGTNAISSVDLSSAYNGISGFSAGMVGVLIFVSNWAGAIYWAVAGVVLLATYSGAKTSEARAGVWTTHTALLSVFAAASVVSVMAACTVLRTHLFVWTVFSPKYLYCIAWSLGMHLGVHIGLGGLLQWVV